MIREIALAVSIYHYLHHLGMPYKMLQRIFPSILQYLSPYKLTTLCLTRLFLAPVQRNGLGLSFFHATLQCFKIDNEDVFTPIFIVY